MATISKAHYCLMIIKKFVMIFKSFYMNELKFLNLLCEFMKKERLILA